MKLHILTKFGKINREVRFFLNEKSEKRDIGIKGHPTTMKTTMTVTQYLEETFG